MTGRPRTRLSATVLGAPEPRELAEFYRRLLGWRVKWDEPDWVMLEAPGGGAGLSFQREDEHVRPVWPAGRGDQQMMMHLDIGVDDLDEASSYAVAEGASVAEYQPQEGVRVLIDPAGHPFCLFLPAH
ncbi:glyoxalase [Streptomyces daqingensis]|uniref:Glyoxalase n=1 Tax=Streptomyces daqingensis TaxID=1472640 RepID=A0ABQ2M280_9ACTN|nr:VOC family protein [Streptomyces daqingensis]GGO45997.1 glyoxalase [Streptomyces daqingensis]